MNYYNEWDKDAAAWLRELIQAGLAPAGDVDERSITEVKTHELSGYIQCHFFAGIGGWPLALRLAGVPDDEPIDSGSCPCQPFSGTGKQMGFADPRHLWPAFRRHINRRRPATVFGEQVASGLGRQWLARVFSDLETMGYAGSGADLCSAGVGAPNIRQRLYWVGDSVRERPLSCPQPGEDCGKEGRGARDDISERSGAIDGLEHAAHVGHERFGQARARGVGPSDSGHPHRLGYADYARREGRLIRWDGGDERTAGSSGLGMWSDCELIFCRDSKWRRIEPGSFPLADGIPSRVGPLLTELRKLGKRSIALARANRNLRLKGYGNAINPWVAARFIAAHRAGGDTGLGVRDFVAPEILDLDAT